MKSFFLYYVFGILFLIHFENVLCAKYNWTANIRWRLKAESESSFLQDSYVSSFSEMRSRLGLDLITKNISCHFKLQDSRILGNPINNAGITNNSEGVFFHEVYFHFNTKSQNIQIGRFELGIGNQRIIAKNNWNNIGRSFEGILIKRKIMNGDLSIFSLPITESKDFYKNDKKDNVLGGIYLSIPRIFNGNRKILLEPYIISYKDSSLYSSYDIFGGRVDIQNKSIFLESEYAYQTGEIISSTITSINFGYRKKENVFFKELSIGTDLVSGDDPDTENLEGFSKFFGARHKHHGYYDYTLHKKYFGHDHEGLKEFNIKGKFNIREKTDLLIAFHNFNSGVFSVQYGNELDIVIKNRISNELFSECGLIFYNPNSENNILSLFYFMITANI